MSLFHSQRFQLMPKSSQRVEKNGMGLSGCVKYLKGMLLLTDISTTWVAVSQNQSFSGLHSLRQSDSTKIDGCELSINFPYSRQEMYLDLQVCFFLTNILVLKSIFFYGHGVLLQCEWLLGDRQSSIGDVNQGLDQSR